MLAKRGLVRLRARAPTCPTLATPLHMIFERSLAFRNFKYAACELADLIPTILAVRQ